MTNYTSQQAKDKVQAIIQRRGLTKSQAAEEMGVSRMQVNRVLDGDSDVLPDWMLHFIEANVTPHERTYGESHEAMLQEWEALGYKRWVSPVPDDNIPTLPPLAEGIRFRAWQKGQLEG